MKRMKELYAFILSLILILTVLPAVSAENAFESLIITNGETNEYSETITYNAGLEDEYSFTGYFLPEGRYYAQNLTKSETPPMFFVRSEQTVFKNGRETPYETPLSTIIPNGETAEFEIKYRQYVYIYGNGSFKITPSDGQGPIVSDPLTLYNLSNLDNRTEQAEQTETDEEVQVQKSSGGIYLDDRMDYYRDAGDVEALLREVADKTGWNVGVVTCDYDYDPGTYGSEAEAMAGRKAEEIYDDVFGPDTDGVLYFCDIGMRYIVVANDARNYIVGSRFDSLISSVNEKYMRYDDVGALRAYLDGVTDCYNKGPVSKDDLESQGYDTFDENGYYHVDGKSKPGRDDFLAAGGIGLIAAIIAVVAVVFHYRVPKAPSAEIYIDRNTLDIYKRSNHLVRTHNYSYTNSSSSGGGYHGGGGGFSGGHHGGGGMGGHR
ncbi:MAG: hypothetical protein ILP19_08920 [Oscillospiraceae bacterium]|nr:hypothetical protein [Oscillospiraceae bacterium]